MSASAVNCAAGRYDRRGAKMSVMREREEVRSQQRIDPRGEAGQQIQGINRWVRTTRNNLAFHNAQLQKGSTEGDEQI